MEENSRLTKLLDWLASTGRTKAWFARTIGYCYQTAWMQLEGSATLTERFVVACFERIPELPGDIFEAHGYVREDGVVWKKIPLKVDSQ